MAFSDDIVARYPGSYIPSLTNPGDDTDNSTIDATVLAATLEDVEGEFLSLAGVTYDSADKRMKGLACDYAVYLLKERAGQVDDFRGATPERLVQRLTQLRNVTHSDEVVPMMKSTNDFSPGEDADTSKVSQSRLRTLGWPRTRTRSSDSIISGLY